MAFDALHEASFDLEFTNNEWGTYYIAVKDRSGNHSTGVMNYYDWPYLTGRRDAEGNQAANSQQLDQSGKCRSWI